MIKITLALDIFDPVSWKTHETENVCEFLREQFPTWPTTARIYHGSVARSNDVTPVNDVTAEALAEMTGPFIVVVSPEKDVLNILFGPIIWLFSLLTPKQPSLEKNNQATSPNNQLSGRSNSERLGSRIPDIFGQLVSTPDLLQVPYSVFINNIEYEYSYMCIGRGFYDVTEVQDDDTLCSDIQGESVEVYAPFTSPNSGDAAQLTIGTAIATPVFTVQRSSAFNGQTLEPPNYKQVVSTDDCIEFAATPDYSFKSEDLDVVNFTKLFESGDSVIIAGASYTDGTTAVDLDGTYSVLTVENSRVDLDNPQLINSDWTKLTSYSGDHTPVINGVTIDGSNGLDGWIGPFRIQANGNGGRMLFNFIAQAGLYESNGTDQAPLTIELEIGIQPLEDDGVTNDGSELTFNPTMVGSAIDQKQRALSYFVDLTGRTNIYYNVRAQRLTTTDYTYKGSVVDTIQWRDLYMLNGVTETDFGNVTTVQTITQATAQATAIKDRKLNMLVTRQIPTRIGTTSTFTTVLSNSVEADDIFCAIALDPYIGGRTIDELDVDSIYDNVAAVRTYFGIDNAAQFSYTFDDNNVSSQETLQAVAQAVFCTAYRRGNVIKLTFEQQNEDSVLLFNYRNKTPGSEQRTITFGFQDNFDGVTFQWVDPGDVSQIGRDQISTLYMPADMSAKNPKQIKSVGVRNRLQAYFAIQRAYNKILFNYLTTKFTALAQAAILGPTDRILVTDNTRPDVQDGQVIDQNVLQLTLSQDVTFDGIQSYTIFLQHYDGTVEAIAITAGTESNQVVLATAPALPLVIDPASYTRTAYEIVGSTQGGARAFLVTERDPNDNFTSDVTAINYDDRYYGNDLDYVNGVVDDNGFPI